MVVLNSFLEVNKRAVDKLSKAQRGKIESFFNILASEIKKGNVEEFYAVVMLLDVLQMFTHSEQGNKYLKSYNIKDTYNQLKKQLGSAKAEHSQVLDCIQFYTNHINIKRLIMSYQKDEDIKLSYFEIKPLVLEKTVKFITKNKLGQRYPLIRWRDIQLAPILMQSGLAHLQNDYNSLSTYSYSFMFSTKTFINYYKNLVGIDQKTKIEQSSEQYWKNLQENILEEEYPTETLQTDFVGYNFEQELLRELYATA